MPISKYLFQLTSNNEVIQVPNFIENVKAVRIRLMNYTSKNSSTSQRVLIFKSNLKDEGKVLFKEGNNNPYLIAFPILNQATAVNTYTNYFDDPDITYKEPQSFGRLEFRVYNNNVFYPDIDSDNPITMELYFYH